MSKLYYCVPTYRSFEYCRQSILSALASTRQPDKIVIIDNSTHGGMQGNIADLMEDHRHIEIWHQGTNIGVAPAWNKFMQEIGDDHVIIANDDIYLHGHTLAALLHAAENDLDGAFFAGPPGLNLFSLFLLPQRTFTTVGSFDENFFPAYFEDGDYVRRLILAGAKIVHIPEVTYEHVGSSTIKKYTDAEMSLHHAAFKKNEQYYISKWGGLPWQERYATPFNR